MNVNALTKSLMALFAWAVVSVSPMEYCVAADPLIAISPPITALAIGPTSLAKGPLIATGSQAGVSIASLADFDAKLHGTNDSLKSLGWSSTGRINGLEFSGRWISVPMTHVSDVLFTVDGQRLVVVGGYPGENGVAAVVDVASGHVVGQEIIGQDLLTAAHWGGNGNRLLLANMDGIARICTLTDDSKFIGSLSYDGHAKPLLAACFLSTSSLAVTAGRDQTLKVWDVHSGESSRSMHIHTGDVVSLAEQPRDDSAKNGLPFVASASTDRTVRFWQPTIGRMVRFVRLKSQPLSIGWCRLAPESGTAAAAHVIAACRDGNLRILDPQSATVVLEHTLSSAWLHSLAVDQTGKLLIVGDSDGNVYLFR